MGRTPRGGTTGSSRRFPPVAACAVVTLVLGAAMLVASRGTTASEIPEWDRAAWDLLGRAGIATLVVGTAGIALLLTPFGRRALGALEPSEDTAARLLARPYASLFVISFVVLFVELMLIRYCSTQLRVFAFYKNVPLIGAFLGLGVGCCLGQGRPLHAMRFLLWLFPVAVFLSTGSIAVHRALSWHAARGSSELILGDRIPAEADAGRQLVSQLVMAGVSAATLVVLTLLFVQLGRLLGGAFERVERLPGYSVNIAGSLAGVVAFAGVSFLEQPPATWFVVGLLPLLLWMPRRTTVVAALALLALDAAAVMPTWGETVWSPYQRLIGHHVAQGPASAYRLEISDVFYQMAVDRRPETLAAGAPDLYPHYDAMWRATGPVQRVLVVGAGTGNDAAAALRAGAQHVDAVEIDPAIVRLGRLHHPERPYDDPRVRVIVDDARHAFRVLEPGSYDAVVFGLLDSHTQLGNSSVRLDNYVFTVESFAEAGRLVRPGGFLVVTAATFRPWFYQRIGDLLRRTTGGELLVTHHGHWWTWVAPLEPGALADVSSDLPTDDWPFLYLPRRAIPAAYVWVVGALSLVSLAVVRLAGLPRTTLSWFHGHLFFLGAAFLTMEVHAINRLALLFGTTWVVSGMTIALVLLLIVAANLCAAAWPRLAYSTCYAGLAVALVVSYLARPEWVLGGGNVASATLGLLVLSPVFFAGLVFARSFRGAPAAGAALGANILGAVLGGWLEYATMASGIRALVWLAAALYGASLLSLLLSRGTRSS